MKKLLCLFITLMLIIPTVVFAEKVDLQTPVIVYDEQDESVCRAQINNNNTSLLQNGTDGFYLTCVKVTCTSGVQKHTYLQKIDDVLRCTNQNTNPNLEILATAVDGPLAANATCATNGEVVYGTVKFHYQCGLVGDTGGAFQPPANQNNQNNQDNQTNNNGTTNPQTGINTYYMVLGATVALLSGGLYIVNKKNLFKKI